MVREGEEVQIIDNNTKDDLTEVTLAQIIYEEQKAHSRSVPLQTLKELIHARTEKVLADLREGPIGRLIPGVKGTDEKAAVEPVQVGAGKDARPGLVDQAKEKLEEVQHQLDERVRAILATFRPLQQLQQEVRRLNERIEELEHKLKGDRPRSGLTRPSRVIQMDEGIRRRGVLLNPGDTLLSQRSADACHPDRTPPSTIPSPTRRSPTSTPCTASRAS